MWLCREEKGCGLAEWWVHQLGADVTSVTPHSLQADVFAYGIILCETIARVPADPDYLPRTEVTLAWEQGEVWVAALGLGPLHQRRGGLSVSGRDPCAGLVPHLRAGMLHPTCCLGRDGVCRYHQNL